LKTFPVIHNAKQLQLDLISAGLSFPTSLTIDNEGNAYVAESGLPFDGLPSGGRVLKIGYDNTMSLLKDRLNPPVTGLTFHKGSLYVSEGGYPGRVLRIDLNGNQTVILDNLPGLGNYHTNMVAFSSENDMYFSQGAMTNSGIVGADGYELGWLRRFPHSCDIPGYDITLAGVNVEIVDPTWNKKRKVTTGAFSPFGTRTRAGQRIVGQLPCTAAIMKCKPDGSNLELVAWGLRNAFGIGFLDDGRLLATDQGADDRGARPIGNAPDLLYNVREGAWYGWPDFIGGVPVTDSSYKPTRGPVPSFLLSNHKKLPSPERPLMCFPVNSAPTKFDTVRSNVTGWAGKIVVALFGDEKPMTAEPGPKVGRSVISIDPSDWTFKTIVAEPLNRPIDVRFDSLSESLLVLDFGEFEIDNQRNVLGKARSGKLWRMALKS
jgi:glucose/arabinose dehydrogenase